MLVFSRSQSPHNYVSRVSSTFNCEMIYSNFKISSSRRHKKNRKLLFHIANDGKFEFELRKSLKFTWTEFEFSYMFVINDLFSKSHKLWFFEISKIEDFFFCYLRRTQKNYISKSSIEYLIIYDHRLVFHLFLVFFFFFLIYFTTRKC